MSQNVKKYIRKKIVRKTKKNAFDQTQKVQ